MPLIFRCYPAVSPLLFSLHFDKKSCVFNHLGLNQEETAKIGGGLAATRCRGDLPDGFCRIVRLISTA